MSARRTEWLIQQAIDGEISTDDFAELEQLLLVDPEALASYRKYAWLSSSLETQHSHSISMSDSPVVPVDKVIQLQSRRTRRIALMAAAAVIVLSLIAMRLFFVDPTSPPTLSFQTSPGTLFTITHDGPDTAPEGQMLQPGSRLQISQGVAELTFKSGVKSVVLAPADLTLHSDDQIHLHQGTAWFHVPKQAIGFEVKTSDLRIVDLGTRFGVLANPDDHDEIHVIKGKVEVTTQRLRKESTILNTGEARRIDPIGRLVPLEPKPAAFLSRLPSSLPYLHWSFDQHSGDKLICEGSHPIAGEIESTLIQAEATPVDQRFIPGPQGKGLRFNGKNEAVTSNWPGIHGDAPRSIAFWFRIPNEASPKYDSGVVAWGTRFPGRETKNTKWNIQLGRKRSGDPKKSIINCTLGGLWLEGSTAVNDGQWHQVCVTYSGKHDSDGKPDIQVYLDGKRENSKWVHNQPLDLLENGQSKVNTSTNNRYSHPFTLGRSLHPHPKKPSYFHGDLDEVYVFFGQLSAQEVSELFERPPLMNENHK
ncbi:FecR domain-containing protein [Verrucomicrobiaceae bacterium N1E253]|uniref:FecR domain-containing protein n=1 Tax=Oceaniferula marina TaxID=2748318 RepID=A0A851GBV5_9BACT|nr:LamG-like jellyroll fold domain-containing protein [Oceaniferula marina]NWK55083.1 FecR domain-containing protein [Oceaniferula marina]